MVKDDFKRFAMILAATAEAVDKELSPQRIAVYFDDLIDLDIRAIEFAVKEHRKQSEFFPKIAKIRELAKLWKAPALPANQGQKLLESKEQREARYEENRRRMAEISEGLKALDQQYGTDIYGKFQQSTGGVE